MVPSPDLGQKFECFKCSCKFYDLGAPEPICPRCGADQREDPEREVAAAPEPRRKRGSKRTAAKSAPAAKSAAAKESSKDSAEGDEGGDGLLDDEPLDDEVEESLTKAIAEKLPDDKKSTAKK